jgi:hypothetical protein
MSTNLGKSFDTVISEATASNSVQWVIPSDIYTKNVLFRVQDTDKPNEIIDTLQAVTIEPNFVLSSGPGVSHAGDYVYIGSAATCKIVTDTNLKGFTDFSVQLTPDPQFQTGIVSAVITAKDVDPATQTITISWVYSISTLNNIYYRISTTDLVANGYPYELTATSQNTISIVNLPGCKNPSSPEFDLCGIAMVEKATGKGGTYLVNSDVLVILTFVGTFSGTASFQYSTNGGTSVSWTTLLISSTSSSITFQATLPAIATSQFIVQATVGSKSIFSSPFNIVNGTLTIDNSIIGSTLVITQFNSNLTSLNAIVTINLIQQNITWKVGYSIPTLNPTEKLVPAIPTQTGANTFSLSWRMSWTDFANSPATYTGGKLVVSLNDGLLTARVPVTFQLSHYSPSFVELTTGSVGPYGLNVVQPIANVYQFKGVSPESTFPVRIHLISVCGQLMTELPTFTYYPNPTIPRRRFGGGVKTF